MIPIHGARLFGCVLLVCTGVLANAAVPPDWAFTLAASPTPACAAGASAVVLLDQTVVILQDDGTAETTHRIAIKILADNGTDWAAARVNYVQNHEQVRATNAWLIRNGNPVRDKNRDAWMDVSIDKLGTLYGEQRYKANVRSDAVSGDVYVAETRVTAPLLISQLVYAWGWRIPVVEQTLRVTLPPGFQVRPFSEGNEPPSMTAAPDGRTFIWSAKDRPLKRTEPLSPVGEHDCFLGLQIEPPATASRYQPAVFRSWQDVAHWVATLNAAQCDSSPTLHETALRITKDCATGIDKISALGRYVQKLPYVARDEGLGRGLGYQAHKASQVFATGYGDCKDKANLLCAMLREAGIEAHVAVARIGDDGEVAPDFPSPAQFDHAIAAIRVDDSTNLPAVTKTERWGTVLFFDATDAYTSTGDLPVRLQGSRVQIQDGSSDSLVELPRIPPESGHVLVRRAELHLSEGGAIDGRLSIEGRGQAATQLRAKFARSPTEEALRKMTTELLGDSIRSAQLANVKRQDRSDVSVCGLSLDVTKPNYTQHLPSGLMVASFDVLGRGMLPTLSAPERRSPIKLDPIAFDDEISLVLPEGFAAEEIPSALTLSTEFGTYQRKVVIEGQKLTLIRHAGVKPQIVPAANYGNLRKFLSDFAKADRASVLLKKI